MTFQSIGEAAAKVVDVWAWWRAALANPAEIGKSITIHIQPEQGYYRVRGENGQWQPVAIWKSETGEWLAYRKGREVRDVEQLWTYACRQPIEYAAYEKAMAGEPFEDEPPAPVGHNSGATDPFEAIAIELAGEADTVGNFLKSDVRTQAQADTAGIWAKRLADIAKRADGEREREKAPHLQASREVDDKWRPVIGDAKDLAARLKKHVEAFLIAQKRAEEERARKARDEAERLKREALEAAAAAHPGSDEDARRKADDLAKQAKEAEEAAKARNASAGRTGARVSVRTVRVGVVVDYAKAAAALVAMRHPDMIAEIDRLAKNAATKNFPFDGMEIREEEKVV